MPVTKRIRYEILKRDNHTCRYCGAVPPDAILTVDHVTPVALGGGDDPSNLVAACRDCNYGKASTTPDAALVDDVKQTDIKWAAALQRAADIRTGEREREAAYRESFLTHWPSLRGDLEVESSLNRLYGAGLPVEEMVDVLGIAFRADWAHDRFAYFMGTAWNRLTDLQAIAKQLLVAEDAD